MFGILEKMDRFSNNLMTQDERIDFIQELVDTGMVYDMHEKYQSAAVELIAVLPNFNPLSGTTILLPVCAVNVFAVN